MGLQVLHLHLHGLFRGHNLELGRDADTGGQTTYVLELVRALAAHRAVERVDVVTRLIHDRRLSTDYAQPSELIGPGAVIRRLPFGPKRYLRKELLWPHLDELVQRLIQSLRSQVRLPDWIHAHYADAGYVGAQISQKLAIPLLFTGHSLGREKRRRLLAAGQCLQQINGLYAMERRIEAEEITLAISEAVITSTRQELEYQYARYGQFNAKKACVIPPGVDSSVFYPASSTATGTATATGNVKDGSIGQLLKPFLRDPGKPPVLAICRADPRKNISALLEVFGRSSLLRRQHNLVLFLGCRDDPHQLERPQRELFQQLFELVDRYDLYGQVAYPKRHLRCQVPALYRWASGLGGVFVNPALSEPFGLTLLEAAACGLPVVATDDGGPSEILKCCRNGLLVDVSDLAALQAAVEASLADPRRWRRWRARGIKAVSDSYSWPSHVEHYLKLATAAVGLKAPVPVHQPRCNGYLHLASSS